MLSNNWGGGDEGQTLEDLRYSFTVQSVTVRYTVRRKFLDLEKKMKKKEGFTVLFLCLP